MTISQMENIYSTAKICDYKNSSKCDLALEPEITEMLMHCRDPEELKHIWVEWRKASGEKIKSLYPKYVELANTAARLNNFSDYAATRLMIFLSKSVRSSAASFNEALIEWQNLYREPMATVKTTVFTTARLHTARAQEEIRRRHRL